VRGRNALWWACACFNGFDAVALRLLDIGGVDVDAKENGSGSTPLFWACRCGYSTSASSTSMRSTGTAEWCACYKGLDAVALRLLDASFTLHLYYRLYKG